MSKSDDLEKMWRELRARLGTSEGKNGDALTDRQKKSLKALRQLFYSRRDFIKLAAVGAAGAALLPSCENRTVPTGLLKSFNDDPWNPPPVADIKASADCLNGTITYRKFSTVAASNLESAMEAVNPFSMVATSDNPGSDTGFAPLQKSYGHPEIVHLTQDDQGNQILSINEYTYTNGMGLEETTIPLWTFKSSFNGQITEYNRVVALNGPLHNTKSDTGKVIGQKMILAGVDYNLQFQDPALNRDINNWLGYATEVGKNNELHKQLMLYYQYSENAPIMTSQDIVPGTGSQWQSLNLIDDFKAWCSWLYTAPYFPFTRPYDGVSVVITDLAKYQDGMGNAFLYGTIKADYFYNVGFVVTFTGKTPSITWFAPAELSINSFQLVPPPFIATLPFLQQFYPRSNWGSGTIDNAVNQETGLPREIIESDLFHQTFKPLSCVSYDPATSFYKILFAYRTLDTGFVNLPFNITPDGQTHTPIVVDKMFCLSVDTSETQAHTNIFIPTDESSAWTLNLDRPGSGTGPCTLQYTRNGEAFADVTGIFVQPFKLYQLVGDAFYPRATQVDSSGVTIIGQAFLLSYDDDPGDFRMQWKCVHCSQRPSGVYFVDSEKASQGVTIENDDSYQDIWFNTLIPGVSSVSSALVHSHAVTPLEVNITYNHQGLMRVFINSKGPDFPYMLGWYEIPDRTALEQYGTVNVFDRFNQGTFGSSFFTPMPVSYKVDRLLEWNKYLHDGEIIMVGPAQNGVDTATRVLKLSDDADGSSYYYGMQDSLENAWKLYELQGKVPQPLKEVTSENRVNALMHHLSLQVTDASGNPVPMPTGSHIEVRTSDNVQLLDVTDESNPKTVNLNRTISYLATPDGTGQVVLQINLGNQADLMGGTSFYYRIVNSASLSHHLSKPLLKMKLKDGDGTTGWKVFNISYAMHQRMDPDNYNVPQIPGQDSPHDRIGSNFNSKYKSQQGNIEGQFQTGYGQLAQASAPDNATPMSHSLGDGDPIDPLTHVLVPAGVSAKLLGHWWDKLNPLNWARQLAKLAKKALDEIIDKIKAVIDKILNSLADMLSDLGATGLANACRMLESAIDTVLDVVETFCDLVLDIIIGCFSFQAAWEIGQALRGIVVGALSDSGVIGNLQTMADSSAKQLGNLIGDLESGMDSVIDGVFGGGSQAVLGQLAGSSPDWNSISQAGTAINRNGAANKTRQDYPYNQIRGNIDLDGVSASLHGSGLPQSLTDYLAKVGTDVGDLFDDAANDILRMMDDIKSGNMGSAVAEIGVLLKQLLHDLFKIIIDILNGAVGLIEDLVDGSLDILNMKVPDAVADIFNYTLKPLFGLSSNLVYWSDLGFFITGFVANIAGTLFGDAFKVDVHGIITGSDFSEAVMGVMNGDTVSGKLTLKDADQNMELAATILSLAGSVVQGGARLIPDTAGASRAAILGTAGCLGALPADMLKIVVANDLKQSGLDMAKLTYDTAFTVFLEALINFNLAAKPGGTFSSGVGGVVQGIIDFGDIGFYIDQVIKEGQPAETPCTIAFESLTAANALLKIAYGTIKNETAKVYIVAGFLVVACITCGVDVVKINGQCG